MPRTLPDTHKQMLEDMIDASSLGDVLWALEHIALAKADGNISMEGENSIKIELRSFPLEQAKAVLRVLEAFKGND